MLCLWPSFGAFTVPVPSGSSRLALNPPLAQFVQGLSRPREVRLLTTVAKWQLLPESYLYGLADVRIMSDFYSSFLLG